jgi:hypothetical protein
MATRKRQTAAQEVETGAQGLRGSAVSARPRLRPVPAGAPAAAPTPGLSSAVAQLPLRFTPMLTALPPLDHDTAHLPPVSRRPPRNVHQAPTVRECFGELRAMLSEGWEIVQPIFARPLWSVTDDSTTAFNFVLRRERTTRLLTVPEGRTVQRFIREQRLLVDYRR